MPKGVYERKPRQPKQYPPELVVMVRSLYGGGMTIREVAAEVGLSAKVVYRVMQNHGIQRRAAIKRNQRGRNNDSWRGGKAGYAAFHYRLRALRGRPKRCEVCGTSSPAKWYDWANLTGRYDDPSDFKRMCRSCHRTYDNQRRREGVANA